MKKPGLVDMPPKVRHTGGIFMYKRNKYDYQFRLRCVEAVVIKGRSISRVAKERGLDNGNLRLWLLFYEKYGREGLKPRTKQHYEPCFKQKVLDTIDKEFLSLRSACVRFNIPSESVVISWRKAYELYGQLGLVSKPKGRPPKMDKPLKTKVRKSSKALTREEELLKENEYLKAQNELLKKLHALVQTEQKRKP